MTGKKNGEIVATTAGTAGTGVDLPRTTIGTEYGGDRNAVMAKRRKVEASGHPASEPLHDCALSMSLRGGILANCPRPRRPGVSNAHE